MQISRAYIADQMFLNADNENTSALPEGTLSNLAAAKYIKDNDKNKDGVLTSDEVSLSPEAFAKLDTNSDGKVTLAEMETALKGQDNAIFQYYNKSGSTAANSTDLTSTLLATI